MTAKVSVVLPTFNDLDHLPNVIDSLRNQTLTDFELIIVNDGSTDKTEEYLQSLTDPRIHIISQNNQRLPSALNAGLKAATGELVTWVSSDNFCAPYFLEAFVSAFNAYPQASFAYSAFAWIDNTNRIFSCTRNQQVSRAYLLAANPGLASFMYRRECHELVGWYDPGLEGAEDWDMWLRITERCKTIYVPEILYYYRTHPNSMTSTIPDKISRACAKTVENTIARLNGCINIADFYEIDDLIPEEEAFLCLDMAIRILNSPFCSFKFVFALLQKAYSLDPANSSVTTDLFLTSILIGENAFALQLAEKVPADIRNLQQFNNTNDGISADKARLLLSQIRHIPLSSPTRSCLTRYKQAQYSFTHNKLSLQSQPNIIGATS